MKNMYAVILGLVREINQLFLAARYEPVKDMIDNRLGISEIIVQQNLFFPQAFNLFPR